ncbi:winged helix-turn-helix transcriptional regulator [Pseudonocardia nigra]|uniref:winged helix-turn-helix transcriptional regulator n=1 Tax=Pseudonocardia nigra TaxID=1921578 RepID=UPI0027E3757E|nr:helix-turn-helix domain-containing protein [Pseudonocardia nigra]
MITASLRAMERDGMLTRTVHAEIPPHVEYELTALGRTLLEPLAAQCAWTRAHLAEPAEAREAHRRRLMPGDGDPVPAF